jgi:hypothetical protein
LHEGLGDGPELDVHLLGRPPQHVERLLGGDALALHEDPLRLSDQLTGPQGLGEVFGSQFAGGALLG